MRKRVETVEGEYPERKSKSAEQALSALMRYAAKAERSSGDAMRLMRRWNVPEQERAGVLERLVAMHFIDDERYARAYVREKSSLSSWGIHKIRSGLRGKGVAKDIVELALEQLPSDNSRLVELLERKLGNIKGGTAYEVKGKLFRFGMSRGYGYDEVSEAVDKVMESFTDSRG